MDQNDGGYGYPPYEEDPRLTGQDSGTPQAYRGDPAAYGVDSSQQYDPNYQGYSADPSAYGTQGYSAQPSSPDYTDPSNPYAPHPIDPNYGYEYAQPSGGYADQQNYYAQPQQPADGYGTQQTGRYYEDPDTAYATRRAGTDYTPRSATGRTTMPSYDSEYGTYSSRGNTSRTQMPVSEDGYSVRSSAGSTSRTRMPENTDEYSPRGSTGRMHMPDGVDEYSTRGNTTRTRYPQTESRYADGSDDDDERYERPRSGKKKRSKFGKFMHALGLYLAQLPVKTLVLIGGTFAVALVAVVLLAVLLPNSERAEKPDDGQLAIADMTPTPSLAPTDTPAPTEALTPEPTLPALTEDIKKAGTVSDLIPAIQERLVDLGYMDKPSDGYTTKFGPATKTAIRLFQMKNFESSDDWDGIIGNGTYTLLMSDQAKAYYLSRGDGDDRTKVITKLVEDVTKLQNRLIELGYLTSGSATGLYGATTVQAVQKFQEYHGLEKIDGKAGQETLKLIYSAEAMDAKTGAANNKSKAQASTSPSTSPGAGTTTAPTTTTTTSPSTSPSTNP